MEVVKVLLEDLCPDEKNARKHDEKNIEEVKRSLEKHGQFRAFVVQKNGNRVLIGNCMLEAMKQLGWTEGYAYIVDVSDEEGTRIALADNQTATLAEWDFPMLKDLMQELGPEPDVAGWSNEEIEDMFEMFKNGEGLDTGDMEDVKISLKDRYLEMPLSVLNCRSKGWQTRKSQWLSLGLTSEVSRGNMKTMSNFQGSFPNYYNKLEEYRKQQGREVSQKEFNEYFKNVYIPNHPEMHLKFTEDGGILSTFDPVVCELMYYWFSFEGAKVLDVFAGGSVRGIVASMLGQHYTGIDLRQEQIDANYENGAEILKGGEMPNWICGNSMNVKTLAQGAYDFVFSCPPYFDLEVYSDSEEDLSNQSYEEFLRMYRSIIKDACSMLKDNRFAVFVVGDVRDKKTGFYRNFVSDTIAAFEDAGLHLYNEIILVTQIGSVAVRAKHNFEAGRKVGKTHQNVLVFYKGDNQRKIKEQFKDINILDLEDKTQDEAEE